METTAVASATKGTAALTRLLLVAPPVEGGIAAHISSLLRHLDRDHYFISLVCEQGSRLAEIGQAQGVNCYELNCTLSGGKTAVARRALALARILRDTRPHIVHAHGFVAGGLCALANKMVRQPALVLTVHNYPTPTGDMIPTGIGERIAFGFLLKQARRVVTVSNALRLALITTWPQFANRYVTIHNGIATNAPCCYTRSQLRERLAVPADHTLVGMVARFAPQKGIAEFIRGAREVSAAYPPVTFVLAGDGPLMAEALQLRTELGLADRLRFPGHVDWSHDLIAALDVLVIASRSEGSSVVAMEGMSRSRPIVATAVGGVPEVVADNETGILIPPGDTGALARAIVELLLDPARRQQLGERGRQRAAQLFDVSDMVEKTKAVYADVMRERIKRRER